VSHPGRQVWRAAVGGRAVAHTAARLQVASLRLRRLGDPVALRALGDPLRPLRAGPPDLALLDAVVDRLAADPGPGRRRPGSTVPARPAGLRPPPAAGLAGTAADRPRPATAPTHPGRNAAGAPHLGEPGDEAAAANPDPLERAATPGRLPGVPATSGADPAPRPPGGSTPPRPVSSAELAAAAWRGAATAPRPSQTRTSARSGRTATPGTAADAAGPPGHEPELHPGASPDLAAGVPGRAGGPAGLALDALASGALGELLVRWDQARPRDVPRPARSDPGRRGPALAPASDEPAAQGSAWPAAGITVDGLEQAIDELLRREAEQNGLEGGLA